MTRKMMMCLTDWLTGVEESSLSPEAEEPNGNELLTARIEKQIHPCQEIKYGGEFSRCHDGKKKSMINPAGKSPLPVKLYIIGLNEFAKNVERLPLFLIHNWNDAAYVFSLWSDIVWSMHHQRNSKDFLLRTIDIIWGKFRASFS